jgi:hypothetical protein
MLYLLSHSTNNHNEPQDRLVRLVTTKCFAGGAASPLSELIRFMFTRTYSIYARGCTVHSKLCAPAGVLGPGPCLWLLSPQDGTLVLCPVSWSRACCIRATMQQLLSGVPVSGA